VYVYLPTWQYTSITYVLHRKEYVVISDTSVSLSPSVYMWSGQTGSTWYAVHLWVQCASSRWQMNMDRSVQCEMARKQKYLGNSRPSAMWSTINPTHHEQGSKQRRRGGKPATNRLGNDTTYAVFNLLFSYSAILRCLIRQTQLNCNHVWVSLISGVTGRCISAEMGRF
jgi:hypothetical protein